MTDKQFEAAMRKIRRGDKNGLQDIYEAYIGLIYTIVKDILHSKENAEDVASEFFIRLWDKADSFQSGRGHKAWITTIARNMAVDHLRKYGREEVSEAAGEAAPVCPDHETADQESPVERKVLADVTVKEALAILDESERQIMYRKVLGEMTFREIAQSLQMPMGTVTWKYQNAVKKLRRCGYGTGF